VLVSPLCRERASTTGDQPSPAAVLLADESVAALRPALRTGLGVHSVLPATAATAGPDWAAGLPFHESEDHLVARVAAFRDFLRSLPYDRIAVVAHCVFLKELAGGKRSLSFCEVMHMDLIT
jgi:hypothetical protein